MCPPALFKQAFTDEGSRRLPKRLNYCFSVLASATNRSIKNLRCASCETGTIEGLWTPICQTFTDKLAPIFCCLIHWVTKQNYITFSMHCIICVMVLCVILVWIVSRALWTTLSYHIIHPSNIKQLMMLSRLQLLMAYVWYNSVRFTEAGGNSQVSITYRVLNKLSDTVLLCGIAASRRMMPMNTMWWRNVRIQSVLLCVMLKLFYEAVSSLSTIGYCFS